MVKFSRGDNELGKIIFLLKELCSVEDRPCQPITAANDASKGHQLLGANMDFGEGVLTKHDELLTDLSSLWSSIQGKL